VVESPQLSPDHTTLWYLDARGGDCSPIDAFDILSSHSQQRFQGGELALSPDGSRLAYVGCDRHSVDIADLRDGTTWTARVPPALEYEPNIADLLWRPGGGHLLVAYQLPDATSVTGELALQPAGGTIHWGPTVLRTEPDGLVGTTPSALYVPTMFGKQWAIDVYDWTLHVTSKITLSPAGTQVNQAAIEAGVVYMVGEIFKPPYPMHLYRVGPDGTETLVKENVSEFTIVADRP
jgi:hypothetical protein